MTDVLVSLDGSPLHLTQVEAVARRGAAVELAGEASATVEASRAIVEDRAADQVAVYGVNTGFGSLSQHRIEPEQVRQIQANLVRSHAAGAGPPLPEDEVRAMLLVLAASLARGRSGVRPVVIHRVLDLLNHGIVPVVPSRGSVGASGDLAPLAHAALVLIGEGQALVRQRIVPGDAALAAAEVRPLELQAKEGLALLNGTHLMAAQAALSMIDAQRIVHAALAAAALSIDACRATDAFLDPRVLDVRGQPGPRRVAQVLRRHLSGSAILQSHRDDDPRVQDPYSLRAVPQVLGAVLDTIDHAQGVVERELGAVTDNPLVFAGREPGRGEIISAGNFHGMPVAIAMDTLAIALCHLAGIAERRIYWVLSGQDRHNPVPAQLSPEPGLHSGLMIVQYTAAACCNELQTLATPASVANIPTSAGIEDYNSMGATAARQLRSAVELARTVVACELLVMAEALDHQRPLRSGPGVERTHEIVRQAVPPLVADRPPSPDIRSLEMVIDDGAFVVESD
jgi:histidine ammonia-lyase